MTTENESAFGANPGEIPETDTPEPGTIAEEMQGVDERDAARAAEPAPEAAAEPETGEEAAATGDAEDDSGKLPDFMTEEYLSKHPEDAQRWSELRGQRNDFRSGLKSAQEIVAARDAQIAALNAEVAAARAQAQAPQAPAPEQQRVIDPIENPAEFAAHLQMQAEQRVRRTELDMYERLAVERHGADKVEAAFNQFEAAKASDPTLEAAVKGARDPWAAMVAEMDRRTLLAEIGDDPAAYKARVLEEARAAALAEAAAGTEAAQTAAVETALATRSAIPSSIATAPGAGRNASTQQWSGPAPAGAVFGDSPLNQ